MSRHPFPVQWIVDARFLTGVSRPRPHSGVQGGLQGSQGHDLLLRGDTREPLPQRQTQPARWHLPCESTAALLVTVPLAKLPLNHTAN